MTPIDIIANAIRTSLDGEPPSGLAQPLAVVAANALTDERIVANAAETLRDDDGSLAIPDEIRKLSAEKRRHVAAIALLSVGSTS